MKFITGIFALLLAGPAALAIPGPVFIPLGKSVQVTAVGSPGGAYLWTITDSSIASLQATLAATVTVTGTATGPATLSVFFQDGVTSKSVEDSVQIIVYDITSAPIVTPTTILAAVDGSQLQIPIESLIVVDTGSASNPVPLTVNFSFFDPDDTSSSAVIDPNGPLGADNAPVARGGRSGATDMWAVQGTPAPVLTPDGQSANVATTVAANGGKINEVLALFRPSNIAGDNYLFTVKIYDPRTNQLITEATSHVIPVRRSFSFGDLYQTTNGPQIGAAFFEPVVDPQFSGDGYTDFTFSGPQATQTSPEFLLDLVQPTDDETPDALELTNYLSDDPALKSQAKVAITAKAQHWYDRVSYGSADPNASPQTLRTIRDLIEIGLGLHLPTDRPAMIAANQLSEKEDGDPSTGKTAFYPDGITIQGGPDGLSVFAPDGDWPPPANGILELPSESATQSAKMMLVLSSAAPATIEYAVLHTLGHSAQHTSYGDSDHNPVGTGNAFSLMFAPPLTASGLALVPLMFSDQELLHIRGWK